MPESAAITAMHASKLGSERTSPRNAEQESSPTRATTSSRGWKTPAVVAVALIVPAILLIAWLGGLRVVHGNRASALVAADLSKNDAPGLRTSCPTRVLWNGQVMTCNVTNIETGETVGTVQLMQRKDGLGVQTYSASISGEIGPTTPPPTSSPSPAPPPPSPAQVLAQENASARARVGSLKRSHPEHIFGRYQPAKKITHRPWIVSISGRRAILWKWIDPTSKWRLEEVLLRMRDVRFDRIQNVDITGDGRLDFLLKGTEPSSGLPFGSVVVNRGSDAKAATFKDSQGRYGATFNLKWTGSELISDYGSWNRISVPGGYSMTRWKRKGRTSIVWVETPA